MKNKDKCCSKMSGMNVFLGILIGLVILVFGGKIILSQTDIPTPQFLDTFKLDQMLEKKVDKTVDLTGEWKAGEATLTLNEDGTASASDMEDVTKWEKTEDEITLMTEGETTYTLFLEEDSLKLGETTYSK